MEKIFSDLKILIVEDQAESRMMLRGILADMGIVQVIETDDGRKAIQFFHHASDAANLILCDWNMPSLSGMEFLHQVREINPDIPFVMITGRSDQLSVAQAKSYGATGYIRKPYSPVQIEAKLRAIVHRKVVV